MSDKKFVWDSSEVISDLSIEGKESEKYQVSINKKDGKSFVGIWRFYKKRGETEYKSSGKGINIPVEYLEGLEKVLSDIKVKV